MPAVLVMIGASLIGVTVIVKISVAEAVPFSPPSATVNVTAPDVSTPSSGVHVTTPTLVTTIPAGAFVSE